MREKQNDTNSTIPYILLHEIGHAQGLKHPGDYSPWDREPFLPANEDNTNATFMSYYQANFVQYPTTPMVYDVSAIQFLYGVNSSTNAGDDVYRFDGI
ncbi:MAG: hypothetical protein F6K62_11285 [Sphaerospermopsis sp. SIO1G2]|nr:hypothetical protein [Sphaerospermopsis sp. SIO1G2]